MCTSMQDPARSGDFSVYSNMLVELIREFINSMPARMKAVVEANDGHTKW